MWNQNGLVCRLVERRCGFGDRSCDSYFLGQSLPACLANGPSLWPKAGMVRDLAAFSKLDGTRMKALKKPAFVP
jgi:hypothetical protein